MQNKFPYCSDKLLKFQGVKDTWFVWKNIIIRMRLLVWNIIEVIQKNLNIITCYQSLNVFL